MNPWKVIFATLVIFGAGLVVGGLVGSRTARIDAAAAKPAGVQASNPSQNRLRELLRRMDRELELTPEQHGHIEKIIAASQERTQKLWSPIAQEMHHETQKVCEEIREELTPEQKTKFDTFSKQRTERHKSHSQTNTAPTGGGTNFVFNLPANQ